MLTISPPPLIPYAIMTPQDGRVGRNML